MKPIIIQASWINDAEFAGFFYAMQRGWYADAGLSIEHRPGYSGLVPEQALLQPETPATIALTAPESLAATLAATGARLSVIGTQFQRSPIALVSGANGPMTTLDALAGRTIAVPPANRPLFDWLVRKIDAITIVDYDHDTSRLMRGEVDAFVDFPIDAAVRYHREGFGHRVVSLSALGAPLFNNVIAVRTETRDSERETLARWLAVSRRGWQAVAGDVHGSIAALWRPYFTTERTPGDEAIALGTFLEMMAPLETAFEMTDADIAANRRVLTALGLASDGLFSPLAFGAPHPGLS